MRCGFDHASLSLFREFHHNPTKKITTGKPCLNNIRHLRMKVVRPVGHLTDLEFIDFLLEILEYGVHALRRAPDPLKCLTFPLIGLLQGGPVNVPHQCFGLT